MSGAAPVGDELAPLPAGLRRSLVTFSTLVISIMATIDATIVAVCMPQMQGSLDATPVTIVWVMTMFSIGQAIGIAVTGKLALRFGRLRVMSWAIVGFVVLSCACAAAATLDAMVVGRFLQGLFAAPLIPLSQATIVDAYPARDRAKGLSVWAMGVVLGPAIGPAVGGLLTEHVHWRMCFLVNVPIGVVALVLAILFVRRTERVRVPIDWTGFLLASAIVVPLQVALDQGDTLDWFGSRTIVLLLGLAALAAAAFVARGLVVPNNILPLRLFLDRNFALATASIALLGVLLFAQTTLYPVMLEELLGWQVDTAGLLMGTFGIGGFTGALLAPKLVARVGARMTIVLGASTIALGQWLGTSLDMNMGPMQAVVPGALAVFGIMVAYVPVTAAAFSAVKPDLRDDAAAEFNFVKTVGMSIGVSIVSMLLYRRPQFHWNSLAGNVRENSLGLEPYLRGLEAERFDPLVAAVVGKTLGNQATMLAVIDVFFTMAWVAVAVIVLALLVRGVPKAAQGVSEAPG